MRISMQTLQKSIIGNLNRLDESLSLINKRISTGKDLTKPSDNPVSLVGALGQRTNLAEIVQYQRNLTHGTSWIESSETALTQIKDLVMRARVLAIQSINSSLVQDNRTTIAAEVTNLFEQAVLVANSQINGKYLFGGARTTGYTDIEPAPFIIDRADGYRIHGQNLAAIDSALTTDQIDTSTDLVAGDLMINGEDMGAVTLTNPLVFGLSMDGASNLKDAINTESLAHNLGVSATLTTLSAGGVATADTLDGADTTISFMLNAQAITVTIPDNSSATDVADLTVAAINAASDQTGVQADRGDGANGGLADTVVLRNMLAGDESDIVISSYTVVGTADAGLSNGNKVVDATHNTGTVSLTSATSFEVTTSAADDTILNLIGLGGGAKGDVDEANDGTLLYGYHLNDGDFTINGLDVSAPVSDSKSSVYADASAEAKATAINLLQDQTGVEAIVTPAYLEAQDPVEASNQNAVLTSTVTNDALNAGDLAINGFNIGAIAAGAVTDGLNMDKAANAVAAINATTINSNVSATLTTLSAGTAAMAGTATNVSFILNGIGVNFATAGTPAEDAVAAINAVRAQTGVRAVLGNGTNGGAAGAVVLRNATAGNDDPIVITGYNEAGGTATTGLGDINQAADASHNTGQITFSSSATFTFTSPGISPISDTGLAALGLGGGSIGSDEDLAGDGTLTYVPWIDNMGPGDLVINGVDIFTAPTAITDLDYDNVIVDAINAQTDQTGIKASRNASGTLLLTATDGRNLQVKTSAHGESVTHLNGGSPATPQDKVYFGALQLRASREFVVEDTATDLAGDPNERALASIGMVGGSATTGESTDIAGDGRIYVESLYVEEGNVRYTGAKEGALDVKVGKGSSLDIGKNGKEALMDTGVFSAIKGLERSLLLGYFTGVTGPNAATDTTSAITAGTTGLERDDEITSGDFLLTVTDHSVLPPVDFAINIGVDPGVDSLDAIAKRISGVPGVSAYWDIDGKLQIESTDPERYTISFDADSSNFLAAVGITTEEIQIQAIGKNLLAIDNATSSLATQISDYGAKANRIQTQKNIFTDMNLNTTETLSELEDTDLVQATMELKSKEVAYQAALAAAAKALQMSLVDFLQ